MIEIARAQVPLTFEPQLATDVKSSSAHAFKDFSEPKQPALLGPGDREQQGRKP
jgi:hypothetical protein